MQANYYYYCYGHDFKTKLTDIKHRRYSHVLLHIKFQAQMYNAVFTKRLFYMAGIQKDHLYVYVKIFLYFGLSYSPLTFRHMMPLDKTVSA